MFDGRGATKTLIKEIMQKKNDEILGSAQSVDTISFKDTISDTICSHKIKVYKGIM